MSRTPKAIRRSLFFSDLATPIPSTISRPRFSSEPFSSSSDLPPPPPFTLEEKSDFSPEPDHSSSPLPKECSKTAKNAQEFATPLKNLQHESPVVGLRSNWWSASKSSGGSGSGSGGLEGGDKGKGSPVDDEVMRVASPGDQEEWVTVYGFSPVEINMVLREFEKCGAILKHVSSPREANWMHILYQNRFNAQKALSKNGTQLNGFLIIGVKPVDPIQRQALNEKLKHQGFVPLPHSSSKTSELNSAFPHPYHLQNGSSSIRAGGTVATPTKSYISKIVDLLFGI